MHHVDPGGAVPDHELAGLGVDSGDPQVPLGPVVASIRREPADHLDPLVGPRRMCPQCGPAHPAPLGRGDAGATAGPRTFPQHHRTPRPMSAPISRSAGRRSCSECRPAALALTGGQLGSDHRPAKMPRTVSAPVRSTPRSRRPLSSPSAHRDAGDAAATEHQSGAGGRLLGQAHTSNLAVPGRDGQIITPPPRGKPISSVCASTVTNGVTMAMTTTGPTTGSSVPRLVGNRWAMVGAVVYLLCNGWRSSLWRWAGPVTSSSAGLRSTPSSKPTPGARSNWLSFLAGWFAVVLLGQILLFFRRRTPVSRPLRAVRRAFRPGGRGVRGERGGLEVVSITFVIPAAEAADQGERALVEFFDLAGAGLNLMIGGGLGVAMVCSGT